MRRLYTASKTIYYENVSFRAQSQCSLPHSFTLNIVQYVSFDLIDFSRWTRTGSAIKHLCGKRATLTKCVAIIIDLDYIAWHNKDKRFQHDFQSFPLDSESFDVYDRDEVNYSHYKAFPMDFFPRLKTTLHSLFFWFEMVRNTIFIMLFCNKLVRFFRLL